MSILETLNNKRPKKLTNVNEDRDPPEGHSCSSTKSRILDIERAESAKRAAQIQHTERLCATQKAQTDAVLKRLGFSVQHDALPSPRPQAFPRRSPELSLRGRTVRHISGDNNRGRSFRTKQTLKEEDPFFEKKLRLGSQMAILSCKLAKFTEACRSPSPDSPLSSVDLESPKELRAIGQFTPSPPPVETRRRTRLPVMTLKHGEAEKDVADGCKLQTAQIKVEKFAESLEKIQLHRHPSPQPTAAPRRAQVVTAKVEAFHAPPYRRPHQRWKLAVKPKVPAPPVPPNKTLPYCETPAVKPKVPTPPVPLNKTLPNRGTPAVKPKVPPPPVQPNKTQPYRETPAMKPKVPTPPVPPKKTLPYRGTPAVKTKVPTPPVPPNKTQPYRGTPAVKPKVPPSPVQPNKTQPYRETPAVKPKVPAPPAPPNKTQPYRETPAVKPKVPVPPVQPNKTLPYRETPAVKPKVLAPPYPLNKRRPHCGPRPRVIKAFAREADIQPLVNPAESLSLFLQTSDDWETKLNGLNSVRALVRHHPALLQTKLHEVCLILKEEVNNLRSVVSCSAMDTVGDLHVLLGRAMDTEAEWTGSALLLKLAKTTNIFVHQRSNLALDALVKGCCPGRVMSVLFNSGLSHASVAVRESTAQHLNQLADLIGEDQILTSGKIFTERFLTAVSKMAVDAAPKVRHHGQKMIQGLAQQRELIPEKYLYHFQKIFRKLRL